ncbi:MAG: hypothetical protein LBJ11_03220 [Oscillospiraceae bacterium]|jgi:hypothetical protein|nr:hypothetical protein [Oscillospiraceae bacterium]
MKKAFLLVLALVLALSLAACGGKDNTDSGTLNRDDGNTPGTSQGGTTNPGSVPDLSALMGGNTKLSGLDAAQKQAIIDAAKADGVTVEFKADGSTVITEADGQKSIQNPDGTWTFEDEDGTHNVQIGGEWPDNEFTKLLPKPEFPSMNGASTTEEGFSISFPNTTVEQTKAYVEKVKAKGFTVDADITDEKYGDVVVYLYSANNGNGYRIEVSFSSGQTLLSIIKE